jgi:tRNA threonylcarbamoyladenosine biosynthesis protein TsaB
MKKIKIDTSNNKLVSIELEIDTKKPQKIISDSVVLKSEAVIPLIDKLLKKNNLALKDVNTIEVSEGPGSFTGLRVGISIANALGFLLKIPVNGRKIGELANPVYN